MILVGGSDRYDNADSVSIGMRSVLRVNPISDVFRIGKERIIMKKQLALLLVLLLAASLCAVCTASAEGSLSAPGSPGPIWLGAEPRVINIMIMESPKVSDFKDNEYTKWIEKSCNVDLRFTFLPSQDTLSRLSTLIAGDQLRAMGINVIAYRMSLTQAAGFADSGAFMDLSEYFQKGLAVNCDKANAEFPEYNILKSVTTTDGKIYGIPRVQISPSNECRYKMWVNEAWLKKLGMEVPKTTEEFHNMLVRFKNEDPNGNGKPDEIPFVTSSNGWGGTAYKFLTNSFVFEGINDMFMLRDGKISVSYIQPEWFEACEYLKQLHSEGLLSDQSFTYGTDDLKALLNAGDTVGAVADAALLSLGVETNPVRLRFIPIDPLVGPHGVQQAAFIRSSSDPCWFVTPWTKEQDPELAELCFRVGDFQFCEEGYLRGMIGVEGQNWSTAEDYKKEHPDVELVDISAFENVKGKYVFFNNVRDLTVNNLNWYSNMPIFSGMAEAEEMKSNPDINGTPFDWEHNAAYRWSAANRSYQALRAKDDVVAPALIFSDDELDQLGDMQSNIVSYVNEERTKYILGLQSDIADRDRFIENLKGTFFLDTLLEVANNAYQREYGADAANAAPAA